MKVKFIFIITICSFSCMAQPISLQKAQSTAQAFFDQQNKSCRIESVTPFITKDDEPLFYIVNALPSHYAIVAANEQISPIIAWSETSQFDASLSFTQIFVKDISNRLSKIPLLTDVQKEIIRRQWETLDKGTCRNQTSHSWPESGTTITGGWIETHWTQTDPYNNLCPMDPISNTRSYAGCPAITMGQIINYLKTTQNTRFNDNDDYTHNYAGRNYSIDDDAEENKFPSFTELNAWLDSTDVLFQFGEDAVGSTAAAIVFACGTACKQVYTSQGSGTFAITQAFDAYQRFGFGNCTLHETTDTIMYATLIDNMKNGFPAHLAVVDESWETGHNVVVDGYREDGYFHINFGWGGSNDGWWLVPDPSFPYSMGVLEGIILDIIPDNNVFIRETSSTKSINLYPNPADNLVFVKTESDKDMPYSIFSLNGQKIQTGNTTGTISVSALPTGVYLIQLTRNNELQNFKLVIE